MSCGYPPAVQIADENRPAAETTPPEILEPGLPLEYVGFGRRAAARLIDMVVHVVISALAGIVIVILAYFLEGLTGRSAQIALDRLENGGVAAFLLGLAGAFLYDTLMEGLHGSTVGKRMVGLTVLRVTADTCTLPAAAKRSLLYYYDALFFGLVAEHSMSQTPRQQRYGDRWADTVVVRRRSVPPSSLRSFGRFALVMFLACLVDGAVVGAHALASFVG